MGNELKKEDAFVSDPTMIEAFGYKYEESRKKRLEVLEVNMAQKIEF